MDHTDTCREEPAIWQGSCQPIKPSNACTDGDNSRGANVVRFAPTVADSEREADSLGLSRPGAQITPISCAATGHRFGL